MGLLSSDELRQYKVVRERDDGRLVVELRLTSLGKKVLETIEHS